MKSALEQDRRRKTDIGRQTTRNAWQAPDLSRVARDGRPEKMDDKEELGKQDVDVAAKTEPSDDAIIERIRNGDMNAFELLARRYERWVCGIVSKRAARDQVPDIAQEVFIHAYRSLPHYAPRQNLVTDGQSPGHLNPSPDGFKHWLATIAVRCCYDYQRAVHRHPTCAISNSSAEDFQQMERTTQAAACETFHVEMEQDTRREALREAIDGLDADDQILLGLIYGPGYSLPETADILGDSLETVKSRARRVRAMLRHRLDPVEPSRTDNRFLLESVLIPG